MAAPRNDLNAPAIAFLTLSAVFLVILMVIWYRCLLWWRRKGSKIYNDPDPGPRGPVYPPPPQPPPPPPPVVPGDGGNPQYGGFGEGSPPFVPPDQPRPDSRNRSRRGQSPSCGERRDRGNHERDLWMIRPDDYEMYRVDDEEPPIERKRDEGRGERRLDSERPGSLARGGERRVCLDGKGTEFGPRNDRRDRPQRASLVRPQSEGGERSEGRHRHSESEAGRRERPDRHRAHHADYGSPHRKSGHEWRGNLSQHGDVSTHSRIKEKRYRDERQRSRRQVYPIMELMSGIGNHKGLGHRRSNTGSIDIDRRSQESREHRERVHGPLEEIRGMRRGSGHGSMRRGLEEALGGLVDGHRREDSPQMTRASGT